MYQGRIYQPKSEDSGRGDHVSRQSNLVAQGAMLAAVAALLGLSSLLVPVLGVVANVIWTIPIIVIILRFDLRAGVMSLLVALILVAVIAGPMGALSLGLKGGLTALIFGYAFKKGLSPGITILGGGIATVVGTAFLLLLAFAVMGGPLLDLAELENMVDQTLSLYKQYGLLEALLEQGTTEGELREQMLQMMGLAVALLPGAMFLGSLTAAAVTYLISRRVLKRLGYSLKPIPAFRYWQVPWYSVWGLIAGLAFYLAGDYLAWKPLALIGQNIIYIYLPLLLINGLAVATYYYHRWSLSPFLKGILLALSVFYLPIALPFLIIVGAFDPLFNYRKLSFGTKEGE